MEQWKSSIIQSELNTAYRKVSKLKEELKLERDINSFDRSIRTKNYDL